MKSEGYYLKKTTFCGKARCQKCRDGIGHGPYWYAKKPDSSGKTTRIYLGSPEKAMSYLLDQLDQLLRTDQVSDAALLVDQLNGADPGNRAVLQRILALLTSHLKHTSKRHPTPFIGRTQEYVQLLTLLQQRSTLPRFALLAGGAGLGKTRLAEEVSREVLAQGGKVVWGQAYAQERHFPYTLWSEVLLQVFPPTVIETYRSLVRSFPSLFEPLSALLPYLEKGSERPLNAPGRDQFSLWQAIGDVFVLLSLQAPLLIVLDDLHWADTSSLSLLTYLARHVQGSPIAIIGTYRENELDDHHSLHTLLIELQREQSLTSIEITPLLDDDMNLLLAHLQVPAPMMYDIRSRAAGNPLFAEELTWAMRSSATSDMSSKRLPLPDTISSILDLRLSQLSPPCQHLLRKASVLGDSFEFALISALEGNPFQDSLHDHLEEAMKAGILVERGTTPQVTYTFWHPLLTSHLYQQLSAARRMSLHLRVAEALQRLYPSRKEEMAAALAHHLCVGGGDSSEIAYYAELAGDRAYQLCAYPDATAFYRLAIEHLELQKAPQNHVNWRRFCLARCLRVTGSPLEARPFYDDVLKTWQEREEEAQLLAILFCELGLTWYDTGDLAQALACYQYGEEYLQKAQIQGGSVWARLYYEQSYAYWRLGEYEKASWLAENALTMFQGVLTVHPPVPTVHSFLLLMQADPVDIGRSHQLLGLIRNGSGATVEALAHLHEALVVFEDHRCLRESAIVCCNLGDVYIRRAEYAQAQTVLSRCLQTAEQIGDIPLAAFALGNLGILSIRRGELEKAELYCRRAIETAKFTNDPVSMAIWTTHLAIALTEQERFSEAQMNLVSALKQIRISRLSSYIFSTLYAVARLRLAQAKASSQEKQYF